MVNIPRRDFEEYIKHVLEKRYGYRDPHTIKEFVRGLRKPGGPLYGREGGNVFEPREMEKIIDKTIRAMPRLEHEKGTERLERALKNPRQVSRNLSEMRKERERNEAFPQVKKK